MMQGKCKRYGLRRVKLADDDVGALRKLRGEQTVETCSGPRH
jgi:hypothetical protein